MAHDYRSPLDHENKEPIRFDSPHRNPRKAQSTFPIPPTDTPIDCVELATNFLEAEYANPNSAIHQDPKLLALLGLNDNPPKTSKTASDVFDAAHIWLKSPIDHSIVMRYPTELMQRNGYLGDGPVTLYHEIFERTQSPRMVTIIKRLGPNTLGGIVQGHVIDQRYMEDAKALDSLVYCSM